MSFPTEGDAIAAINRAKQGRSAPRSGAISDSATPATPPEENEAKPPAAPKPPAQPVADSPPAEPPAKPTRYVVGQGDIVLDEPQLQALVQGLVNRGIAADRAKQEESQKKVLEANQNLADKIEQLEAQLAEKDEEIERKENSVNTFTNIFSNFGALPGVGDDGGIGRNTYYSPVIGATPNGLDYAKEFRKLYDKSPRLSGTRGDTGEPYFHRDTTLADAFFKDNRDAVLRGMDSLMRQDGFLRGRGTIQDAPTAPTDLPPYYLGVLEAEMRLTHSPTYILWQFVKRDLRPELGPGQLCLFPRTRLGDVSEDPAAWNLTAVARLTAEIQPIVTDNVSIPIIEYGMGKDINMRPIGYSEVVLSNTLTQVMEKMNSRIAYNYRLFEDALIRALLFTVSRAFYNSGGNPVEVAPGAGEGGTFSFNFLVALESLAFSSQFIPLDDGCFTVILNPTQAAQLKIDLSRSNHQVDRSSAEDLTRWLSIPQSVGSANAPRLQGYLGRVSNCHVFVSNAFATGAAGDTGVETVGTTVARSGFLMGKDPIGWVEGMPMSLYKSKDDDYGRLHSYVWRAHVGCGALDIDPLRTDPSSTTIASEQWRVLEIRTTDAVL